MIKVGSINGHVQHLEGFRVISAEPDGAFFRITYGRPEIQGLAASGLRLGDNSDAPDGNYRAVDVYYTADYGRELFRVERTSRNEVSKQEKWWAKLIIRKKKKAD